MFKNKEDFLENHKKESERRKKERLNSELNSIRIIHEPVPLKNYKLEYINGDENKASCFKQ